MLNIPSPNYQDDHRYKVFNTDPRSVQMYLDAIAQASRLVAQHVLHSTSPLPEGKFAALSEMANGIDPLPAEGSSLAAVIREIGKASIEGSLMVSDPAAMARLHCPVSIPALAAEVIISAMNQSMDSWDQSPFATLVEERLIQWLTELVGFSGQGSGCFTSGGANRT